MTQDIDPKWAWKDGAFVPYENCTVHVRSQAVMIAGSVFEGIKAYWSPKREELYLFRVKEHLKRLVESMKIMRMQIALPPDFGAICAELCKRNDFPDDVHVMPTAYLGFSEGNVALGRPTGGGLFITAVPRPPSKFLDKGKNVGVSSWSRISDRNVPPRVKATGNYQNGRLALNEAWANGFDDAIMLNDGGSVSEAPGACLMMVRNGQVCTPPITGGILESITRATLMELFEEKLSMQVIERPIDRTELYLAEEVFLCGSGMEVAPVISIDRIPVGSGAKGPLTKSIQDAYFSAARGDDKAHLDWLTPVYSAKRNVPPLG